MLWKFNPFRRIIRRHTKPIPEDRAGTWKKRLSLVYMLVAWNAFGVVCYNVYSGKGDWAKFYGLKTDSELNSTPAQQWSKTLGIKDAKVYRVSGLKVTSYEIHNEDEKEGEEDSNSSVK